MRNAALSLLLIALSAAAGAEVISLPPSPRVTPNRIAAGPDNAMWFTATFENMIGRYSIATRTATFYTVPTPAAGLSYLVTGADGGVWFIETDANKIGRVDPATGQFREYTLPVPASRPYSIAAGPDGALWFTELAAPRIGRITTAGAITEFAIPAGFGAANVIINGNDGVLTFTQTTPPAIGRITTAGIVTETLIMPPDTLPYSVARANDGTLWITTLGTNLQFGGVLKMTAGSPLALIAPVIVGVPKDIIVGADGTLWIADERLGLVHSNPVTGSTTRTDFAPVNGVAAGPDGGIWFTVPLQNAIGRVAAVEVTPAVPRRRTVKPPSGSTTLANCTAGVVAKSALLDNLTAIVVDATDLFIGNVDGDILRVPKNGGTPTIIARVPGAPVIASMVADATRLYFTTIDIDTLQGGVYTVEKSGGTPSQLADGIPFPVTIDIDGNDLFFVSLGTPEGEDLKADGSIQRVRKDGSNRQTLAGNLSAPFWLDARDGFVWFSESGLATGNDSAGVRRVAASGGAVTHLVDNTPTVELVVDDANVYFATHDLNTGDVDIVRVPRGGGQRTTLIAGLDQDAGALALSGQTLYFIADDGQTINSVPVAGGSRRIIKSVDVETDNLAIDDCLIYYGTFESIERITK
jgi:virginiamycin B lyase